MRGQHVVVVNDEEQYSIWPADRELPAGWRRDGFTGTEEECLAHIDEIVDRHAAGVAASVDARTRAGRRRLNRQPWLGPDGVAYRADASMPGLFAAAVARDPDAVALVFGDRSVSYGELDRRSNALAWVLRRRGVGVDVPVGVAIERGVELVVALLAVVKAGGALSADRDRVVRGPGGRHGRRGRGPVGAGDRTERGPARVGGLCTSCRVDAAPTAVMDEFVAPPDVSHPLSLAYVSFTSGSTGVPKGVAVPQRAVMRLVCGAMFAPLGPGQRLLQLAPVAFDASTLEIWGALLTGATLVIAPPGPLGLSDIATLLRTCRGDGRLADRRAVPPVGRGGHRRDRRRSGGAGRW